jgi:glycosyltransferase involved in cell wall biosynthesis
MLTMTMVTPTYNQAEFLPATMDSILGQSLAAPLGYMVLDGASGDATPDILARYDTLVAEGHPSVRCDDVTFRWRSGRDGGMYAAIAEGFDTMGGDILGWLNSDDLHMPWTLRVVHDIFTRFPQVQWLTSVYPQTVDIHGNSIGCDVRWGYGRESFCKGANLPGAGHFSRYFIQQDCTFFRRSLWERAGGCFDPDEPLAADFELWLRFFDHAELYAVASPLAAYRVHPDQKTAAQGVYDAACMNILRKRGCVPYSRAQTFVRRRVLPPLMALPGGPALLARLGLLDRVRTIKHSGRHGQWRIIDRDII